MIRRVEAPHLIEWTGTTLGIDAIHFWWLEPRDGTTFVRTAESYDGPDARLFRQPLRRALDDALANGLRYLKAEAERGAGDQP
jgi:chromosome condensin MukBEF complex kleisin-like MukF subunit